MDQAPAEATVRGLIASAALDSPVDVKRLLSPDFDDDAFDDELLSPLSPYEDSAPLDETPVGGTASSSSQIFKLETEKAALEREASARQAELRRFKEAMLASRMATRNEVEELRAALRSFQSEVPALRERLAASKAQFGELRIGEPRYRHLRSKPDDQVSVVEFVQARVFEMTSEPAGYDELPVGVSRPQRSPAENGAARRKAEAESARLQDEVDRLREALQRSKAEVTALRSTKRGGERGEKHGDEGDGREVTHLYELERREVERSRVAEERAATVEREALAVREEWGLLKLDKAALSKEAHGLRERVAELTLALSDKEGQNGALTREAEGLRAALRSESSGQRADFAVQLEHEMRKWQEEARLAHAAISETHERQLVQAREARANALADAERWESRHEALKKAHDALAISEARASAAAEAQLAELRSELKLKTLEAERTAVQCEQSLGSARRQELAAEAAREKLELLKKEYYTLQARTSEKIAELEAKHESGLATLGAYEKLEDELDSVIASDAAMGAGVVSVGGEGARLTLGGASITIPASAKRRVEQCLTLSRELIASGRKAEEISSKLSVAEAELSRMHAQLGEAHRRLRNAAQPQAYLVEQLELKEQAVAAERRRAKQAAHAKAAVEKELIHSKQQLGILKQDLQGVLSQRDSIVELRSALQELA